MTYARGTRGALFVIPEPTPGQYAAPNLATHTALHCVERPQWKESDEIVTFRDGEWSKTDHGPDEVLFGAKMNAISGTSYLRRCADANDHTSHSLSALFGACPIVPTEDDDSDGELRYDPADTFTIGTTIIPVSVTWYDLPTGNVRTARGGIGRIVKIHAEGVDKPIAVDWEIHGLWNAARAKHAISAADVTEDSSEPIYYRDVTIAHGISGSAGAIDFGGFEFEPAQVLKAIKGGGGVEGYRYSYAAHEGRPVFKWTANEVDESASGFQAFAQAMNPAGTVNFSATMAAASNNVARISMPGARYAYPEDADTEGRATLSLETKGGGPERGAQYRLSLFGPPA